MLLVTIALVLVTSARSPRVLTTNVDKVVNRKDGYLCKCGHALASWKVEVLSPFAGKRFFKLKYLLMCAGTFILLCN